MSYVCFHKKGPLWYCGNIARNQLKNFIQEHLILSNWRKRNFSEAFLHKYGRYAIEKEKTGLVTFFKNGEGGGGFWSPYPSGLGMAHYQSRVHFIMFHFKKLSFGLSVEISCIPLYSSPGLIRDMLCWGWGLAKLSFIICDDVLIYL